MVTILPPKTNAGTLVGQNLGQGLGQGIARGGEIGFQRNLLQNSLKGLENLPPGTTPAQLASHLIQATAGIPGAERYVGTLYNSLLPTLQAQQQASEQTQQALSSLGNQPPIQNGGQQGGVTNPNVNPQDNFHSYFSNLLGEKFFPKVQTPETVPGEESFRPLKPPVPPQPIGPAQESMIRQSLMKQGVTDPATLQKLVGDIKQYQQDTFSAQKEGYKNTSEYQKARQDEDNRFFNNVSQKLASSHPNMNPKQLSIWEGLSRLNENAGPDETRWTNTEEMYNQLVQDPLIGFDQTGPVLPTLSLIQPSVVKERIEDSRSTIQDHLKRIEDRNDMPPVLKGQIKNYLRDQYMTSMVGLKDFGSAQAAYAVSNLSDKASSSVPKAPPPSETLFESIYLPKDREKYVSELANSFSKLSPEDSLILYREKALANNYDDRAFNEALNKAIREGKIKLSDYQANERNRLSIPQRLDLNSVMEGKRTLGDLFKAKK